MWIFIVLGMSWISGVTFFIFNNWIIIDGEFGPEKHSLQNPILQIHGFAAFLMIITYGFLIASHVNHSWKVKPLRIWGIIMLVMETLMIITAYILYYIGNPDHHEIVGYIHAAIGFLLPIVLTTHIIIGIKNRNNAKKLKKKLKKNKDKKNGKEKNELEQA